MCVRPCCEFPDDPGNAVGGVPVGTVSEWDVSVAQSEMLGRDEERSSSLQGGIIRDDSVRSSYIKRAAC